MRHFLCRLVVVAVCVLGSRTCHADDGGTDRPPTYRPQAEVRFGGVLEETYNYHRQRPVTPRVCRAGEPASGWYGYGFPVQTFRWGWFGAEHYYPCVHWHHGYYGDCCRYAYRRGY